MTVSDEMVTVARVAYDKGKGTNGWSASVAMRRALEAAALQTAAAWRLGPPTEPGNWLVHMPDDEQMPIQSCRTTVTSNGKTMHVVGGNFSFDMPPIREHTTLPSPPEK